MTFWNYRAMADNCNALTDTMHHDTSTTIRESHEAILDFKPQNRNRGISNDLNNQYCCGRNKARP